MEDSNKSLQIKDLFTVNGLVAVITGGGSGIGAFMARALALNGASKVFIIGRREEALKKTAASVPSKNIFPVPGDVTSKESLQACVDIVKSHTSHADVVIANFGIGGPDISFTDPQTQKPLPIDQLCAYLWSPEAEQINETYAVNLTGVHFTVAAFLPLLHAANQSTDPGRNSTVRPQIITLGSAGAWNRIPLSNLSYSPSKAAVVHMTKILASVLVPYNIRGNVLAPGIYYSEMTDAVFQRQGMVDPQNMTKDGAFPSSVIPATRSGDGQDMAGVILWLCSRAGAYLNGCTILTDGGWLSVVPSSY